jgi:hypothetical protein
MSEGGRRPLEFPLYGRTLARIVVKRRSKVHTGIPNLLAIYHTDPIYESDRLVSEPAQLLRSDQGVRDLRVKQYEALQHIGQPFTGVPDSKTSQHKSVGFADRWVVAAAATPCSSMEQSSACART